MSAIVKNGFAVRIPEKPSRYRANCAKDFGCFVYGETQGKTAREIEKEGLMKGNFVEIALVFVDNKTLTFGDNYVNEPFTLIWGIPTAGDMKLSEKASELSSFLLHRQSRDKFAGLIEQFSKNAFTEWVDAGMKGDFSEFSLTKIVEYYFTNIFRFEFVKAQSHKGIYHWVKTTFRPAKTEQETTACEIAREIYNAHLKYSCYCTDDRLENNQLRCIETLAQQKQAQLTGSETEEQKLLVAS